jgi:hypothetical protein
MTKRIHHSAPQSPRLPGVSGLCYAAGIFDGEGCICISKKRAAKSSGGYNYRLRVTVSQNHLDTLIDFQNFVGIPGYLYPIRRSLNQNRDAFQLIFDGDKAAKLLEMLQPYLLRKAPEAAVALQYQRTCDVNVRAGRAGFSAAVWALRESFCAKLRRMK